MKPDPSTQDIKYIRTFSALGRAVWDETAVPANGSSTVSPLSVLSVEPYGMKPRAAA